MLRSELPAVSPPPGRRLPFLIGTVLGALVAIAAVQFPADLERNIKSWITVGLVALAALLVLFWFAVLSRYSARTRLIGTLATLVTGFGLAQAVRVDGTSSSVGFPRLVWKWTPIHPRAVIPMQPPVAAVVTAQLIPDVPQFFGPRRDGIVTGAHLARDWTAHPPRELWRQPIGAGWSAFAVVGGRAYTHEQQGENEALTCIDLLSGKRLWTLTHAARFTQWQGGEGPRATPCVDRGLVFAYGATGILECADATNGRRVWSREVLKENNLTTLDWGVSASPLVFDDTVVVTGGSGSGPTALAFHRSTGEPLWRSGTGKASYSSPSLVTLAGRRVVLVWSAASLTAHDPATGEAAFTFAWSEERIPKAAQPVVLPNDRIFLSAGYSSGCAMLQITSAPGRPMMASLLWKNQRMKNQFNSVAARDGYLYGLDDGGLACIKIETGERTWKDGRYGSGQTLLVDDLVIIQAEEGWVALADARPEGFHEWGRINALTSKTWNHPTLAGRYLLVRNDREAVCYELPVE